MRLLVVPGEGCVCVLEAPLEESLDRNVVVIPQNQIEELLDPDKTPEFEIITGELALGLKMHLLQEQIAFFEDKENLEWKIRNAEDFPDELPCREEIENEWQKSLERLRLLLDELKESAEDKG
jgi:hypothetical protein